MSANVQVCCRFRPTNDIEASKGSGARICYGIKENYMVFLDLKLGQTSRSGPAFKSVFSFDRAFEMASSQIEVYNHTAKNFVAEVMQGYNCTVFAYGQTGSGKTFTMLGEPTPDIRGIIPRLCEDIFDSIDEEDESIEFTVMVSYVEIYMERMRDLLNTEKTNLRMREGPDGMWIPDVTEVYVSSFEEVLEIMDTGHMARATASTGMNNVSSRSHAVFMMQIGQTNKMTGSKKRSKLILVDLAGSETVKKTGSTGTRLKEAQTINKSLSALGNVINALTSHTKHIPYRDSKLTRLLSDSLGGNSKTSLIITCSPCAYNLEETLSTLRFGTRAKKILNKPRVNQEKSVAEYKILLEAAIRKCTRQEELIGRLQKEVAALKKALKNAGVKVPDIVRELESTPLSTGETPRDVFTAGVPETIKEEEEEETSGFEFTRRARSSSTVMHNLELQGRMQFIEQELATKNDSIKQLQDELKQHEDNGKALQSELEQRDEQIAKLQKDLFESVTAQQGKAESATNEQYEELQARFRKLAEDNERLREDNLDLGKIKDAVRTARKASTDIEAEIVARTEEGMEEMGQMKKKMVKLENNYEVLLSALGRKCEQYVNLQLEMKKQDEEMRAMKRRLKEQRGVKWSDAEALQTNENLQKRLTASDALCQKLFQSGLYWQRRGQRKEEELKEAMEQNRQLQEQRLFALSQFGGRWTSQLTGGAVSPRGTWKRQRSFIQQQNTGRKGSAHSRIVAPAVIRGGGGKKHSREPSREDASLPASDIPRITIRGPYYNEEKSP